nr:pirin family protein [Cellulosimicrobium sp. MM]
MVLPRPLRPDPLPAIGDGTDGMQVPPHPHTGLQTVTWLFAGEILHRDAVGSLQTVRPGELNLMTAGRGISHSEESPRGERPPVLHGVQLWVALPATASRTRPRSSTTPTSPSPRSTARACRSSSARSAWAAPPCARPPRLHADRRVRSSTAPGAASRSTWTRRSSTASSSTRARAAGGLAVPPSSWGTSSPAARRSSSRRGRTPRAGVLVGGEPFGEDIVMWWNFVGRSHDDVARARADWQAQLVVTGDQGPNRGGTRYADGAASAATARSSGTTAAPARARAARRPPAPAHPARRAAPP